MHQISLRKIPEKGLDHRIIIPKLAHSRNKFIKYHPKSYLHVKTINIGTGDPSTDTKSNIFSLNDLSAMEI